MRIELQGLVVEPLLGTITRSSEIWGRDFCFEPGRRYQLDAPSGNGKTSLVHILFGLRRDYRGTIRLDQANSGELTLARWCAIRRRRMAIMFQDLRLFPELTVEDNVQLKVALTEANLSPSPEYMLEALALQECTDRRVDTLSWGERQRVALIRTLSQPFSWLILDEPFSHLDPENISRACGLIEAACVARRAGLILTSLGYRYPLTIDQHIRL